MQRVVQNLNQVGGVAGHQQHRDPALDQGDNMRARRALERVRHDAEQSLVPARRRDHREHHRTAGLEAEMPQVTNERRGVLRRVEQQVQEGTAERVVGRDELGRPVQLQGDQADRLVEQEAVGW